MYKKSYAIALLVLASSTVSAAGFEGSTSPSIEYGRIAEVVVFKNINNQINVGVQFLSDECNGFSNEPMHTPSIEINGTLVKQYGQCVGDGIMLNFPATQSGMTYVHNQFSNNQKVVYKQESVSMTFYTKGYDEVVQKVKRQSDGI